MSVSRQALISRLIHEFGYSPRAAEMVADKLVECSSTVRQAFEQWWATGTLTDLTVEGYDAERLAREHGMKPVAALLTLDWLMREPEKAKASLARGHDHVGTGRAASGGAPS